MFLNMESAYRAVDELTKKWESSGGTLQKGQMSNMSYDNGRHLLWAISQYTFSSIGDLETLSGAYITTTGTIQVRCYSRAVEFGKYRPVCQNIIESVVIDPGNVIPTSPAKYILDGLARLETF
jgi:hypothetical protein